MKLSENWLRQWVNPTLSAQAIGEQLTMAGLELDDLTCVAKPFSGVVVGEVLTCKLHPDADKLKVTTVDVGHHSDTPLQIVCGAPNVAVGVRVPVALVGAELPSDDDKPVKIKKGKLRGVESFGMLCGGSEIDCDDGVDGLLILPNDAPIGMDVREYLGLDNHILDISITPNRGDCFSVRGLAREVAVLNQLEFQLPFTSVPSPISTNDSMALSVATADCPRYFAQVMSCVNGKQPSPAFIQHALKSVGISPKNILVDVTNFVLMELGQPLHAFDKDKIVGQIYVRLAKNGETLTLLNEQTISLQGDELVIADDDGVIALAGIMGGLRTAVSDDTQNIVIESAFFKPTAIAGRARRFGLHTDASQRFERGVDFELPRLALDRAVNLLSQFTHAQVGQITSFENIDELPKREAIILPFDKIQARLGVAIDKPTCIDILDKLEIMVIDQGEHLHCTPPSHRFDIAICEDLIEEIARIYGYDNITNQLPAFHVNFFDNKRENALHTIKSALINNGYYEAISFSFSDDKIERLFDDESLPTPLALANPISSDLAVMRRTLLSSLLPCVQYNLNRQASRVRLFETGLCFIGNKADNIRQIQTLAMVAIGAKVSEQPFKTDSTHKSGMDFYDLKHDVECILPSDLLQGKISYERSTLAFLHPMQSADIFVNQQKIGYLGQLHPKISHQLDLPTTWVAQLDVACIIDLHTTHQSIAMPSRFPQVRRDFAFLLDETITWQQVATTIRSHAGELLQDMWLFDVYQGDNLPQGKRSLAFAVVWQDDQGTLADDAIGEISQRLIDALKEKFGAILRE